MRKWETLMVELLIELRDAGESNFDRAWGQACVIGRERRFPEPRKGMYAFFRRACEREWHGLVHTDYAALRDAPELSEGSSAPAAGRGALGGGHAPVLLG